MKFIVVLIILISTTTAYSETILDLNDVSILLPLPEPKDWNQLWNGEVSGGKGDLLPKSYLKQVPRLLSQFQNSEIYPNIKVLGLRVDPCFQEGLSPVKCKAQIRLIWQPLQIVENVTSTFDASLHSFYELSDQEMKSLLNELVELKNTKPKQTSFLPLGVNPYIKQEGLNGSYASAVKSIMLKYIGKTNLSRITFMQLFMTEKAWIFGGFDIDQEILKPIQIARVNSTIQTFNNVVSLDRPFWFLGGINPEPPTSEDNLKILISDSRAINPQQDELAIKAAVQSAARFENPNLHNPGTLDCASCHVAQPAKIWAMRQYPWFELDLIYNKEAYTSERDLRNLSPMQPHTNIVRAFGYFMNRPFVAQRTINETAAVINYINHNF